MQGAANAAPFFLPGRRSAAARHGDNRDTCKNRDFSPKMLTIMFHNAAMGHNGHLPPDLSPESPPLHDDRMPETAAPP
jgi:hypothetical protein